jgi:hypothetical protein
MKLERENKIIDIYKLFFPSHLFFEFIGPTQLGVFFFELVSQKKKFKINIKISIFFSADFFSGKLMSYSSMSKPVQNKPTPTS